MRRTMLTLLVLGIGVALMVVSYLFLAAPWGVENEANSNPRLQFAPGLFVIGVLMVFGAALVYELFPDRHRK